MHSKYLALLPWLSALLLATPALAEYPLVDNIQASNVRRLLITDSCLGCDLSWTDLREADLRGVDLRNADLTGADLSGVNLENANLAQANLTATNLTGAFLSNTSLAGADLDYANFSRAQLYFVDVTGASMDTLNLVGATVVGTPISIGGSADWEEDFPPIISPEEIWQIHPPSAPLFPTDHLLDVPEHAIPAS